VSDDPFPSAAVAPAGPAAVVVAGGAARRMGGIDKVALRVGGRSLLDSVLAAASPVCATLVVVGPLRPTAVAGVTFVMEAEPGGGPVPAVAAGLEAAGTAATALVLASDLPFLTPAALGRLVEALADPAVTAAAARDGRGRPHPLVAAHRTADLRRRVAGLGAGTRAAAMLPPNTVIVDLGSEATLDVNDRADLRRARARMASPT
jgi:molybdopterin-guanine dinucleotide biosynthesis protein A